MWAGSFDELLLDKPRTDAPMHLPEPPAPAKPWTPPPKLKGHGDESDEPVGPTPQHCSRADGVCHGPDALNAKQRKNVQLYAHLTGRDHPDLDTLTGPEAEAWLTERWLEYMAPVHDEL